MLQFDPSRSKSTPLQHQITGVNFLANREYGALFDEQGTGKSAQIIWTACVLYEAGLIDTVVVVTPASVRYTWGDPEFGEIKTHGWVPGLISEFSSRTSYLLSPQQVKDRGRLYWIITNYEFLRQDARLKQLTKELTDRKVMMVSDEGSFIKSPRANQSKALHKLRGWAKRRYLLNGTPIGNSPLDLWSQMHFLSPNIIRFASYFLFSRYFAVFGGFQGKQIISYQNLEVLLDRVKPHVLRRRKEDCLDLPPKLYAVREVAMETDTWQVYKQMRDQMIAWLSDGTVVQAQQAIVKILRLAQITGGFVSGLNAPTYDLLTDEAPPPPQTKELSREKLDCGAQVIREGLEADDAYRFVGWFRFRAEQERAARELRKDIEIVRIYGGQPKAERDAAIRRFTQEDEGKPMGFLGQQQAGGFGLNLQKHCKNVIYFSNDYSLITRLQSEDRVHRAGTRWPVLYTDLLATGPSGQKTIDHVIHRALRKKQNMADWTTDHWRQAIIDPEQIF